MTCPEYERLWQLYQAALMHVPSYEWLGNMASVAFYYCCT